MGKRNGIEYGRYSSGQQGQGRSEERQGAGAAAWAKRNDVELDTTAAYMDRGTSAFRGKHRKAGAPLRAFLDDVEAGRIARGSVLIIENLDRLSRENPWDAIPLLCQIVNAGVDVATLSPSEMTYTRSGDLTGLILAVIEFGRGHSESKSKSDRLADVWAERKRAGREDGAIITRRLPAWVREKDGKLVEVPERVAVVRRLFDLAASGHGLFEIVKTLTREKVKPWGRGKAWSKAYVRKILAGRAVLGEHQPRTNGQPDGFPPIVGYYPKVIDLEMWEKVQAALYGRTDKPGRVGAKVTNLFSGLLTDARSGERMLIAWQTQGSGPKKRKVRMLVPAGAMEGRQPSTTFPYHVFENQVLRCLKEISPASVTGADHPPESTALAVEAAALQARMKDVEAELLDGEDVPSLARVVRQLDARLQDVLRRLALARQREANPVSDALAEAQTLLDVATDEARRLRLRALLQSVVEGAWVLVVPIPGRTVRLCAVQIIFKGGFQREYLIVHKAAGRGRTGDSKPISLPSVAGAVKVDLRKLDHARELEADLATLNLAGLWGQEGAHQPDSIKPPKRRR